MSSPFLSSDVDLAAVAESARCHGMRQDLSAVSLLGSALSLRNANLSVIGVDNWARARLLGCEAQ